MPRYEPKVLRNGTKKRVEFWCGGRMYEIEPDEERLFDGFVAYHALFQTNTGLTEVIEEKESQEVGKADGQFDKMTWRELLKEAGRFTWFKPGMNRQQIVEALENERRPKTETVRSPAPKEKAKGS